MYITKKESKILSNAIFELKENCENEYADFLRINKVDIKEFNKLYAELIIHSFKKNSK